MCSKVDTTCVHNTTALRDGGGGMISVIRLRYNQLQAGLTPVLEQGVLT